MWKVRISFQERYTVNHVEMLAKTRFFTPDNKGSICVFDVLWNIATFSL